MHNQTSLKDTLSLKNKSIVIVLLGAIGDVVRGLHVAKTIKKHEPTVTIRWVSEPASCSLIESQSYIDEVILFDRPKGILAFKNLIAELRKYRFDICLDMQRHLKSGLISYSSRAPVRIGFHRKNCKELNWLFNNRSIEYRSTNTNKIYLYNSFCKALGIETKSESETSELTLDQVRIESPQLKNRYANLEQSGNYICVLLSSTRKNKNWPLTGYLKLLKRCLDETEYTITLIGSTQDIEASKQLESNLASERIVNLIGETKLSELPYILSKATFALGPDSGPGHISACVGTPYISLFGSTDPMRVAPFQCEDLVVQSNAACSPCRRKKCPGLNEICMRLISPQQVWEQIIRFK